MAKFNDEQKQIAVLLMHEPKSVEELNKQLNITYDKLNEQLKGMLKLKVIEKTGFPTKYKLKKDIVSAVTKRKEIAKEDRNKLRLRVILEAQSPFQEILEKELKRIEKTLRKEKTFTIYGCNLAKMIKEEEHYKSFLEVELSVKDFRSLARLLFSYGPSTVEVVKPAKIELTADELQDGLVDLAAMIHLYNQHMMKLMNRQEIEDFNRKIFGQK